MNLRRLRLFFIREGGDFFVVGVPGRIVGIGMRWDRLPAPDPDDAYGETA